MKIIGQQKTQIRGGFITISSLPLTQVANLNNGHPSFLAFLLDELELHQETMQSMSGVAPATIPQS